MGPIGIFYGETALIVHIGPPQARECAGIGLAQASWNHAPRHDSRISLRYCTLQLPFSRRLKHECGGVAWRCDPNSNSDERLLYEAVEQHWRASRSGGEDQKLQPRVRE